MNNLPAPRTPNDSNTRINQDKKKKNKKKKANQQRLSKHEKDVFLIDLNKKKKKKKKETEFKPRSAITKKKSIKKKQNQKIALSSSWPDPKFPQTSWSRTDPTECPAHPWWS